MVEGRRRSDEQKDDGWEVPPHPSGGFQQPLFCPLVWTSPPGGGEGERRHVIAPPRGQPLMLLLLSAAEEVCVAPPSPP